MSELPSAQGTTPANDEPPAKYQRKESMRQIADSLRGSFQTVEYMAQSFIRENILHGVLAPGERLNLAEIAEMLGVSRISVRSSLRALESEGLVTIHTYRGATVAVLTPDEIAEIYELRAVLECHLLELVIDHVDDELIRRLREIVATLERTQDLGVRLSQRKTFYDTLYERANRPRTLRQLELLRRSVGRHLLLQRTDLVPAHGEFLDYLQRHELRKAQAWVTNHLQLVSTQQQLRNSGHNPM